MLLFLFRRQNFDGITDGLVLAGITATGFAFTENVLYLGNASARTSPSATPASTP